MDALEAIGNMGESELTAPRQLLERIVSMLTRMARP
jgi:hypothetical protein